MEYRKLGKTDLNLSLIGFGGAPLGGIGFQCHYDHDKFTPPERILKGLDRFARFNKPIDVTEFDFDTDDEQLQADATRDLLTPYGPRTLSLYQGPTGLCSEPAEFLSLLTNGVARRVLAW